MNVRATLVLVSLVALTSLSCVPTNTAEDLIVQSPFGQLEFPDGRERDLGIVPEGATMTTSFRIRNVSSENVTLLENVATSCGCTAGTIDKHVIAPNDEATLTLKLSAATNEYTTTTLSATAFQRTQPDAPPVEIDFRFTYTTRPQWYVAFSKDSIAGIAGDNASVNAIVTRPAQSTVKFLNVKATSPYLKSVTIKDQDRAINEEETVIGNVQIEIEFPDATTATPVEFEFFTDDSTIPTKKKVLYLRSEHPVQSSMKVIRVNLKDSPQQDRVLTSEIKLLAEGVRITGVSSSINGLSPAIVESDEREANQNQKVRTLNLQIRPNYGSLSSENVNFGRVSLQYMNSSGHEGELVVPVIIQR